MSQANANPTGSAGTPADCDPILRLHKMSTTAGLGSQEYVAVNNTAVIAVIFSVASVMAFLGPILLVIPVIGVILSFTALRQIRHSNGTQTGRGIAWLALAISAVITATLFAKQGTEYVQRRGDKAAIAALCEKYGQDIRDHKFDDAYALFDDVFKQRVPLDQFKAQLGMMQTGIEGQPSVQSISSNGYLDFHRTDETETAESVMILRFSTRQEAREAAHFRKEAGVWLIDNLERTFPPEKKAGARGSR